MDQEVLDWLSEKQISSYVVIVHMDTSNRVYMTEENKNIETFSCCAYCYLLTVVCVFFEVSVPSYRAILPRLRMQYTIQTSS